MKHSIIFKDSKYYASFPLLQRIDNKLIIGYFKAPMVDHMGVFQWKILQSMDQGETWNNLNQWESLGKSKDGMASSGVLHMQDHPYNWPAVSPREQSDRFTTTLPDGREIATGSFGFRLRNKQIRKSKHIFLRSSSDGWKTMEERAWEIPNADVVLTFPRPLAPSIMYPSIRLIPTYIILENGQNRAMTWHSSNWGESWRLYNMFPDEVHVNEMAFIVTKNGILAHLRSDEHPYIMESCSQDGKTWAYPTNIYGRGRGKDDRGGNVAGGPTHLLRLKDGRILCTYGYRQTDGMGIRAVISDDEGGTWSNPIILRSDGGYLSKLHKRTFWQKKIHSGNDVGYPTSIELNDNNILTAYYITLSDGITGIEITKWDVI